MAATPDDILALVAFARVVEAQSFTAAAHKLGVSKSVVSARITALEDRVGARLLHRTTRRLSLTGDGLVLYERAARITAEADQATQLARTVSGNPRGVLRINAPLSLAQLHLMQPIAAFLARYPEVRVELLLADRFVDLVEEGVDVAIRVSARLRDSSLVARKLADDRTVVCASPAYLARKGVPQTPSDLLQHDCIHYSLIKSADEWRFKEAGEAFSVPVATRFEAANGNVIREAVLAGIGIAVLPSFLVASDLDAGKLVAVLGEFSFVRLTLHAVYPAAKVVPANVRAFVDLLVHQFKVPAWSAPKPAVEARPAARGRKTKRHS